jgi:hypothetical protein
MFLLAALGLILAIAVPAIRTTREQAMKE